MRFTKIVATIGPASDNEDVLTKLIIEGVDVFRFNLSHGDHSQHRTALHTIRRICAKLKKDVGILFDLAGPKFRVQKMSKPVELIVGKEFVLTSRDVLGTEKEVSVNQPSLVRDLSIGETVLVDEGRIELTVKEKTATDLIVEVEQGGVLDSNKGINVRAPISIEPLTKKDYADIDFAVDEGVDWLAISFVREASDVATLKEILKKKNSKISVMAKIEKREAVENIDSIISEADAVMIARGDLGIELPVEEVPLVQKKVIAKSMKKGKIVVTATQMLESMIERPQPTRAEVNDIANAIFDQTDALMLSGETAIGEHPVLAVKTMAKVASKTESAIDYGKLLIEKNEWVSSEVTDAISLASCELVRDLSARLLVTSTQSGTTAIRSSAYRCPTIILAATPDESVITKLKLAWGVVPFLIKSSKDINDMFSKAKDAAIRSSFVKEGDKIVITAGALVNLPGTTNLIKVEVI